jgi:hypothetical protein
MTKEMCISPPTRGGGGEKEKKEAKSYKIVAVIYIDNFHSLGVVLCLDKHSTQVEFVNLLKYVQCTENVN